MARELRKFAVVIPASTPQASPLVFSMEFPPRVVQRVQIVVPPGPRGEVGFQVAMSGRQIIPSEAGAFFVTDDEVIDWPLEDQNTSGGWQLIAYNTGAYNHTLEVRFLVVLPPGLAEAEAPGLIESTALSE